jgi:hypothetical protein
VKQVLLGIDLHKETAVVTMQPRESPAQPAQRLSTRALVGWVEKQACRYPGARIYGISL